MKSCPVFLAGKQFVARLLVCLLCCCLVQKASAQPGDMRRFYRYDTTIEHIGDRQTISIYRNPHLLHEIIRLQNEKKDGRHEVYGGNGKLVLSEHYVQGLLCGEFITFDTEGNVTEKKYYKCYPKVNRSWLHGSFEQYSNKKLLRKGFYEDSLPHGLFYEYQYDGRLKSVANYKNGLLSGEQLRYNNTGALISKTNYAIVDTGGKPASLLNGVAVYYGNGGMISQQGSYLLGKKDGLWKEFDESGQMIKETFYKDNKIHGINNTYQPNGNLEIKSTFYQEITVNGETLTNVFDGVRETYFRTGKRQSIEQYVMGKKNGLFESYYENGNVKEQNTFVNGLQTGKAFYYESDGTRAYEIGYKINTVNGVQVSQKDGLETHWKNGVAYWEVVYKNGKEEGLAKEYYPSGKLAVSKTFKQGLLHGKWLEFYESGQLKADYNYYPDLVNSSENNKHSYRIGWNTSWNENGQIDSKMLYDSMEFVVVRYQYVNGVPVNYQLSKLIELSYFPNGSLLSEKISQQSLPAFERFYYLNGQVRKLTFQNSESQVLNSAEFLQDGTFYFTTSNQEKPPPSKSAVSLLVSAGGGIYRANPFYTDTIKDGKYSLFYTNGKPYAELNFRRDLPDGRFLFYHPVTGDTMLFTVFRNGQLNGPWVEKYAGKTTWKRGYYLHNKTVGSWIQNQLSGNPYEVMQYDSISGRMIGIEYYHDNGKLKHRESYDLGTHAEYDTFGRPTLVNELLTLSPKRNRMVYYHPNSTIKKSESFYTNGLQDSLANYYFSSGKLQYTQAYANGKRNGSFKTFDESGKLVRSTEYKNDKQEGWACTYTSTGVDSVFFINDKAQVKKPSLGCSCIDTAFNGSQIRFVPTLETIVDYGKVLKAIDKYLVPVDSLNYHSIFASNYQFSNGSNAGFTSLSLIIFKELAVNLPADEQIKLILNPCLTKLYLTKLPATASYGIGDNKYLNASLSTPRIALEFLKGPVKSNDKQYPYFRALFDTKEVQYTEKTRLKIVTEKPENDCFVPAIINGVMQVNVTKASPVIFEDPQNPQFYQYRPQLSDTELKSFFGIIASQASVQLALSDNIGLLSIRATCPYMMLGGKFAAGLVAIKCKFLGNDNYALSTDNDEKTITSAVLKNTLLKAGFTRLNFQFDSEAGLLNVAFFTE